MEPLVEQAFFDSEHHLFRQMARRFIQDTLAPHVDRWEEEKSFPREVYKQVGEAGLLGIGGGSDSSSTPEVSAELGAWAMQTRSVVAVLQQVPNQPLYFADEDFGRSEDDILDARLSRRRD